MKIVAIMGQAGSGKDTLIKTLAKLYPESFKRIVSCTTRPPRSCEEGGYDYYFLSIDEFEANVREGTMLEYTRFNDWYYGTKTSHLDPNRINIGAFNPTSIRELQQIPGIQLTTYYLIVNDAIRLQRQLSREEEPDADEIVRRYLADKKDFANIGDIRYIPLLNDCSSDYLQARTIIYKGAMQ